MKLISRMILPLLLTNSSIASTIYGLEHISGYRHSFKKPVYVQMGSFSSQASAQAYQKSLQLKTKNYKVLVVPVMESYKVRIGPFHDASSLKKLTQNFNSTKLAEYSSIKHKQEVRRTHASEQIASPIENKTKVKSKSNSTKWFVNAHLGGQKPTTPSSTTVNNGSGFPSPYNQDIYTADGSKTRPMLGLQIGKRWVLTNPWINAFSFGAQYQYFFNSNITGQIVEFSLPQFTNYDYKWRTASNLLIANVKLNFLDYQHVSPYFNVGLGVTFNQGSYTESALSGVTRRISPGYASNTGGQFAYILGAGLDYYLDSELLMSIGYQFSDLGQQSSGDGYATWSGQRLNFGRNQSNAVLLGMTYLFDMNSDYSYQK